MTNVLALQKIDALAVSKAKPRSSSASFICGNGGSSISIGCWLF
jgi:hypothetical protein